MAAARHNSTRRALLGVHIVAPIAGGVSARSSSASAGTPRWTRALAAFGQAGARLDDFRAEEAAIPLEQRTLAVDDDLDERFNRLECERLAALTRLLRVPAPDLPALTLKIDLIIAEAVWELSDAGSCLAVLKTDARRLCQGD
jgi:hypothetical protein